MSICAICDIDFEARHAYGLCTACFSPITARELDRVASATHKASKGGLAATLSLQEWLSVMSDYLNKCSFCEEYPCSYIEMIEPAKGLVYSNVACSCRACHSRRAEGYDVAEYRVKQYLSGKQNEETS